jgi:hypothetical protein
VVPGTHGYFNSLVARSDHWKSYGLRNQAEIERYRKGNSADVNYLFLSGDPDPRRQDAAKVVVADYGNLGGAVLAAPMSATDTVMVTTGGLPYAPRLTYKIDDEVVLYSSRVTADGVTRTTVQRGQNGTRPAAHAAGAKVGTGSNSLQSQVRLPMGTEDGHSYLVTWDAWYGKEVKLAELTNWKTYQFAQGTTGDGNLGLEIRTRFDGGQAPKTTLAANEIAVVDMRHYVNMQDPAVEDQITPMRGVFAIRAETWTRYWVLIEHVVGDWDRVSLWVADVTRPPVLLLDRVAFETGSHTFRSFWLEFNTSTDRVVPNRGPLVSYVRNLVMLRDVTNPKGLLAMPATSSSSAALTEEAPLSAPRNLRILPTQ